MPVTLAERVAYLEGNVEEHNLCMAGPKGMYNPCRTALERGTSVILNRG